jgi:hypothetical protein
MAKRTPSPFLYKELQGSNTRAPSWSVWQIKPGCAIGFLRRRSPKNYEVRRPQDADFHLAFSSRREAALWLRDHLGEHTIFAASSSGDAA